MKQRAVVARCRRAAASSVSPDMPADLRSLRPCIAPTSTPAARGHCAALRTGPTGRDRRARSPRSAACRASQTRRPCQISRCGKRAQSARGTTRWRSRSILTGSSWRVSPSRCESRRTCVSTTIPCASPSSAATTFAVLRATPGRRSSSSSRRRHLRRRTPRAGRASSRESTSPSAGRTPSRRCHARAPPAGRRGSPRAVVLREKRRRDAVDVHVGRLRGEHHRDEQLEVAAEAQRDLGVCMLLGQPLDDRPDPLAPRPEAAPPRLGDEATRHDGSRRSRSPSRRSTVSRSVSTSSSASG